jgi:biotin operon repressor
MKLTEEQLKQCVKDYKGGASLGSLAEEYGISRVTMTRYIRKQAVIRKPGSGRGARLSARKKRGPEWDELGKIPDEVLAKKVGCSRQNVTRVRNLIGLPSSRDLEIFERMTKRAE